MKSNKVLLVAVNSKFTHLNPVPFYLRNEISSLNYNVEIKQFNINQDYFSVLEEITFSKSHILAFSVYIWNCEFIENLVLDIKNINPEIKIVVGGPEASYNLKWKKLADFIIKGEGEKAFKELAENNFNFETQIVEKRIYDFNEIQFPYLENDLKELENKYVYYEASRGCPYKCAYCISSREDQKLKFKKLETVFNELNFFIKSKSKVIKFVDRSFNCNKKFSRGIWKYLIENYRENIKFHFEIYPELLETEDFEILKNTPENYFQFEIGVQSSNDSTLKEINRFENPEKVRENVLKLMELKNIHIHLDLIAGLPFETLDSIKNSFNSIYNMKGDHFQLGFLKILPGTEMEDKKDEYGMVALNKPPYTVLKNRWLKFEEIVLLHKVEEFLEIYKNSHKFENSINLLEKYFDTPFDLYYQLVKFSKNFENMKENKSLKKYFKLLYEFSLYKEIDKVLINDLLRIDWFSGGNFINVPDFLKTGEEGCRKIPKFINEYILQNIKKCTQRAYIKVNSKEMRDRVNGDDFILFYRKVGKKVYKKHLKD